MKEMKFEQWNQKETCRHQQWFRKIILGKLKEAERDEEKEVKIIIIVIILRWFKKI